MVCMGVCYEHVVDVSQADACFLQLLQYAVPSAGIDKEHGAAVFEDEASVVASGHYGVPCAEHYELRIFHVKKFLMTAQR